MGSVSGYFLSFWHVFLLFAILQALMLCLVLVDSKRNKLANKLLCVLVLVCGLLVFEYVLIDAKIYVQNPHFLGVSIPFLFLLGPVYYFYTRFLLLSEFSRKNLVHLLPSALSVLALLPFYAQTGLEKQIIVSAVFQAGYDQFPMLQILLVTFLSFQLLLYTYFAYEYLQRYESTVLQEYATGSIYTVTWLKRLSVGFTLFLLVFFIAWIKAFYNTGPVSNTFDLTILAIALFIISVALLAYRRPELFTAYSQGGLPTPDSVEEPKKKPKYEKTSLNSEQLAQYKQKLDQFMAAKKPYLDGELRLATLADLLSIQPHHLSQLINVEAGVNFFDYINRHRVEHAKTGLLAMKQQNQSILDVALAAGFNSKASFNRSFKKEAGCSPSEFLKKSNNSA